MGGTPHDVDDEKKLSHESSFAQKPKITAGKLDIIPFKKRPYQSDKTCKRIKKLSNLLREMPPSFAAGPSTDNRHEADIEQLRRERNEWKRKAEKLETDFEDIKKQGREYYNMAKAAQDENERLAAKVDEMKTSFNACMTELSTQLREGPEEDY